MGKTIVCESLEEMCNLMCDNFFDEEQEIEESGEVLNDDE